MKKLKLNTGKKHKLTNKSQNQYLTNIYVTKVYLKHRIVKILCFWVLQNVKNSYCSTINLASVTYNLGNTQNISIFADQ